MAGLFPFAEYWWFYLGFTGFVLLLLALDLGVFHRRAHEVSFREAATWSVVWVALALAFNFLLYQYALWKFPLDPRLAAVLGFDPEAAAWRVGLEFLTGYIVEKSLSVDNIFVFVLVFGYFAVPAAYQHRVLFYGIIGALLSRAVFIFAVDSVPAIFALTNEPLVVFTSNIFAILGLRSLYFMLAGAVDKFYLLKYGLAVILIFVGLKMVWLNDLFGGKFPVTWSLGIICAVILAS